MTPLAHRLPPARVPAALLVALAALVAAKTSASAAASASRPPRFGRGGGAGRSRHPAGFCPAGGGGRRSVPASAAVVGAPPIALAHPTPVASGTTALRSETLSSVNEERLVSRGTPEEEGENDDDDNDRRRLSDVPPSKRDVVVSSSIDLPFPPNVAFDAFSDLPRQPTWSPWLRSVEYLEDDIAPPAPVCELSGIPLREARWTMGYRGLRFSWNAVSTALERPGRIDWESTSGLKNYGTVTFVEKGPTDVGFDGVPGSRTTTRMTLSMKFRAPRAVAALFRRSDAIAAFMEEKMLGETLRQFRDVVMEEDLGMDVEGQFNPKKKG